jgi:transposase
MRDLFRFLATAVIWAAVTLITVAMFTSVRVMTGEMIPIVLGTMLFAAGAAGVGTNAIWRYGNAPVQPEAAAQQARKSKRNHRQRIERLVEQMDEDEIVELETLLMTRSDDTF